MAKLVGLVPFVSVVLVVRNEEVRTSRVLDELFDQDYPSDRIEVIVVDGQSDDATADIAECYSRGDRRPVVMRLTERGRSQGLNRGIQAAKGDVIVRVDARTSISSDYVTRCVETLERTGADNVGGVQRPLSESPRQEAIGLALSHPFGVGNAEFRLGTRSGFVDSVYLGCFRREVFQKVGLFDERASVISEDSDINQRIREAGGTIYLNKEIVAYYYPRERFRDFWRLYYRYGGARAGNLIKHKSLTSWRQVVSPIFVLTLFASATLGIAVDGRFAYLFAAALLTYATASVIAAARMSVQHRKIRLLPLLFCAFACMHISWGLGFWRRLLTPQRAGSYWAN